MTPHRPPAITSTDLFGPAFHQATSALAVLDLESTYVAVNDLYCRLVQRDREQLVGRSLFDVFPDDPADVDAQGPASLRRSFRRAIESGESDSMELLRYDIEDPAEAGEFVEKYWSVTNSPLRTGPERAITHVMNHPTEVTSFIEERLRRQASGGRPSNTGEVAGAIDTVYASEVDRLEALSTLVQSIVACDTTEQVARAVIRDGLALVDASAASFVTVEGERFRIVAQSGFPGTTDDTWRYEPDPDLSDPYSEAITRGEPVMIPTRDDFVSRYPDRVSGLHPDHQAWVVVPLVIDDGTIGILHLAYVDAEPFTPALLLRLYTLANLTAQAASRAVLIAEQAATIDSVHETLRTHLDPIEGCDTSDIYRPATRRTRSGGDWYDIIRLGDHHTLVVMGDVAHHGPTATGEMARARSAIHAYALEHDRSEQIVDLSARALDKLARTHSTAIIAIYRHDTAEFTWTNAGHPFPVVVRSNGVVDVLDTTHGPPLGSRLRHDYSSDTVHLGHGDTLVLYTDGLIERSDESFDDGIARLVAAATDSRARATTAEHFFTSLVPGGIHEDDVAVLTITRR